MTAISYIKDSIVEIAESNDLTIKVSTHSKDELAEMATAFNSMITNFRHLIISVQNSANNVNHASMTLKESIHQSNEGIQSQIQETDMVSTTITEMASTIEEIVINTNDVADKAGKAQSKCCTRKAGSRINNHTN